ncbi:MAG TPA: MBL fold metallo-hydrolase [Candidatus Acidoferrales bacterium]|nr:MBL fold metallo-hydrolase [Candidatus Acidoferrales bacterium]
MLSRPFVTRATLALLAVAALFLAWAQQQPRPPLTIEKVTGNLWVIIGNGGNVAVMPTSEGVLLVDDKFAQDAPEIVAKVKTVSDKPIRYVLNTHQHGDHTGGNDAMMAANAQVLITKQARANMVAGKQPGLPQITYNEEAQVFLGGKEVDARYVGRGHTNGDAVIYFPTERVLHTGDLFVSSGAPFCDTSAGGSIKEWDATIRKALEFDFDTVIPGHGAVVKKADLAKWVNTLATIRSRVQTACAGSPADAAKRLDLKDLGMPTIGMLERGMVGMCKELAQ